MAKVPNTISDKQMAALRRRAEKASPGMFSPKVIAQRKASNRQRANAGKS